MNSRNVRVALFALIGLLIMSLSMACGRGRTTPDGNTPPTDGGNLPDNRQPPPPPDGINPPPPPDNTNPKDTNPPPDLPPPPPKTDKCADLYTCAKTKACGNPAPVACLEQCATEEGLEGAGLTRFNALKTCLTSKCGNCQDDACLKTCITNNCGNERAKCLSDEQAGANSCKSTSTCAKACQDETCLAGCFSQASADAVSTYIQVEICDAKSAAGNLTPADKKSCYDTALACDCPDKAGQGAGMCASYITCVGSCGSDTCCVAKCRSQLSQPEVSKADDFTICAVEKCSKTCTAGDKACQDKCVAEQCSTPYLACQCPGVGPPGQGSQKCSDGLKCIEKCSADDICCAAACAAKVRAKSYGKYTDFLKCLPTCGCRDGDNSCFKNCAEKGKCSSKALSCALN